jgi:pyruvate dehydrogenase E2 component (dihydrolipoyllysine-residue acetyltransferase)
VALEFNLPDLGEGVAEGEIVEWKVAVGDTVTEDQPLVEVMTDKATVEIPSPQAGVIEKIAAEPGAVVPVGDLLVVIGGGSGSAAAPAEEAAPAKEAEAVEEAAPAASEPAPEAAPKAAPPAAPKAAPAAASGSVLAAPATRKLARELGVELGSTAGTGPRGRVTKDDVRLASSGGAAPVAGAAARTPEAVQRPSAGEETVIPYRGLRKKIGDQMVRSAFTAPHFTLVEEVDMTALYDLRKAMKPQAEARGVKITYLPFIMKALCAAVKQHPGLNGILDEAAGEVVTYRDVNIGFALDTDKGLMVPVINDANRKNVYELSEDLSRLAEAGRTGSITREELNGSTITITSAGSIGGLFATPVINHPEVAILGVYRMEDRPVVIEGEIVVRKMMYLSITLDHRVLDGGEAARFMNTMKRLLGDPRSMLMEA